MLLRDVALFCPALRWSLTVLSRLRFEMGVSIFTLLVVRYDRQLFGVCDLDRLR